MSVSIKEKIKDLEKYKNSLNYCYNCRYLCLFYIQCCNNENVIKLTTEVGEAIKPYVDCKIARLRLRRQLLEENCPFYETKKGKNNENPS